VSFTFRCALSFVDTYAHILFLEVNFGFSNRMEEEEFQSQLMVERHYMIDENESSNLHHATTLGSEEVVKEIVNKPSLEDPSEESFPQFEFDLDLYMISEQAEALWIPHL
jgi:hypothetical protein